MILLLDVQRVPSTRFAYMKTSTLVERSQRTPLGDLKDLREQESFECHGALMPLMSLFIPEF